MKLDFLMELEAELRPPRVIGRGPFGTRQIFDWVGGRFEGPRLHGRVLPGGGDWLLLGRDEVGRLDVRVTLETHDSALVFVTFNGVLEVNDRVIAAASGQREGEYGDSYFYVLARFEAGDERYVWLNRVVSIAEGRVGRNSVGYRFYRPVHT